MADAVGGTSTAQDGYVSQSDLLEQSYRQTEQPKIDTLNQKKYDLEKKQTFYNTLNTKLRSLTSATDTLTADNSEDKFVTRKVNTSNNDFFSASASSTAIVGLNQIKVNRLASSDILISNRLTLEEKFGLPSGDYFFSAKNGDNDAVEVKVSLSGEETNEEALIKIVNSVNDSEDIEVSASVIRDTTKTGRFTLTSKTTGSDNHIVLSAFRPADTEDSDEETSAEVKKEKAEKNKKNREQSALMLDKLGFGSTDQTNKAKNKSDDSEDSGAYTSRQIATDTQAGYLKADISDLNSVLEVNGIKNVTRGTNSIDDVIQGITLNLTQAMEETEMAVSVKTEIDVDAVEKYVKPLIDSFNGIIEYLRNDKTMLRGESSVNNLYQNLRNVFAQAVTGENADAPKYLAGIGIKSNSDGTLYIDDRERLEDLLKEDPQLVANIFISGSNDYDENDQQSLMKTSDGLAVKLAKTISSFVGTDGIITSRTKSLNTQIDATEKKTTDMSSKIDRRAYALRKEYEDMLKVYLEAQNQYNYLGLMPTTT